MKDVSSAELACGLGFDAVTVGFALKYLLMPLLILSFFCSSSSRLRFAVTVSDLVIDTGK